MTALAALQGAPEASEPLRAPTDDPVDLEALEAEFWTLWRAWDECPFAECDGYRLRVDQLMLQLKDTPANTPAEQAIKMRLALTRARWTPEAFASDDGPELVAAEILDQVVNSLEDLG